MPSSTTTVETKNKGSDQQVEQEAIVAHGARGDTLHVVLTQTDGASGSTLSQTEVSYPGSMPNDMANLFNIEATLAVTLVALRAAIGKASDLVLTPNPSPGVLARMYQLYEAVNEVVNNPGGVARLNRS